MKRGVRTVLPEAIRSAVEAGLSGRAGHPVRIEAANRVGGGCISPAARLRTEGGESHFVKWAEPGTAPPSFFAEEARSLSALAAARAVRVPAVEARGENWLLLEWLTPGPASRRTWETLGRGLARLHGTIGRAFGWPADNFIGSLPQANGTVAGWPSFWLERRIGPQWAEARRRGFFGQADDRAFDAVSARMATLLEAGDREGPCLLHGDLWGGNVHVMEDGTAALIDPSSYHGHREVDLAMARLFGGFDPAFFAAYEEVWPLEPGFRDTRCPLYQLYYLLVHVNLFGASYVEQARSVLLRFG